MEGLEYKTNALLNENHHVGFSLAPGAEIIAASGVLGSFQMLPTIEIYLGNERFDSSSIRILRGRPLGALPHEQHEHRYTALLNSANGFDSKTMYCLRKAFEDVELRSTELNGARSSMELLEDRYHGWNLAGALFLKYSNVLEIDAARIRESCNVRLYEGSTLADKIVTIREFFRERTEGALEACAAIEDQYKARVEMDKLLGLPPSIITPPDVVWEYADSYFSGTITGR